MTDDTKVNDNTDAGMDSIDKGMSDAYSILNLSQQMKGKNK